jgi:hypothetical protein
MTLWMAARSLGHEKNTANHENSDVYEVILAYET